MNNTFECEPASEIVKLLQITDPHLFKDTSKDLLGINTHESFSQVLKEIQAESFDYDVVLATGIWYKIVVTKAIYDLLKWLNR